MNRIFKIVIVTLFACAVFSSCKNQDTKYPLIGAILKGEDTEFWQQVQAAIYTRTLYMGFASFTATVGNEYDADGQLKMLDTLKMFSDKHQCVGLILAPIYNENDHRIEQAALEYCSNLKIPVVIVDNPIDEKNSPLASYYKCFVGTDNFAAGAFLAGKVPAPSENVVVVGLRNVTPIRLRYEGWCDERGGEPAKFWETDDDSIESEIDAILNDYPQATTFVFLNGDLCCKAYKRLSDKNVYVIDAYEELVKNLVKGSCIKGILAQNTAAIGELAAAAVVSDVQKKNIYVDPIWLSPEE